MKKIFLLFTAICTTAVIKSNAQSTTPTNNFAPGRFLGYVAPFSGNLDFHTAQPAGGGSQMRLQLGTGFLGIGVVNPAFRLDVQDNISVRTVVLGDGYRILGSTVLHVFGSNNTFVGENNGLATTTGANNTFVGNDAGANNTVGNRNTFIGDDAGKTNATGVDNTFIGKGAGTLNIASTNTFVGSAAGLVNTSGHTNCFVGMQSGTANTTGASNTFMGNRSGSSNTIGGQNTYMGVDAGRSNIAAFSNTCIGFKAGELNATTKNTFVGAFAGAVTTSGTRNTFMGSDAGRSNFNGFRNTFVGESSGFNNVTGYQNTFIGFNAGIANIGGFQNTFVGDNAGASNTGGNFNAFFGDLAGEFNTTGINNTFLGHHAGSSNSSGTNNCYIGYHSTTGNNSSTGTRNNFIGADVGSAEILGNDNQYIGSMAGALNVNGSRNILMGTQTGSNLTTDDNVFIGHNSGFFQTTGVNNTYIGTNSGNNNAVLALNNAAAIGAGAIARNDNRMILGNNFVNVGIGLSNNPVGPANKLEIESAIPGASGLRFRSLTATSPIVPNQGNQGVLAVDVNGDVIYVAGGAGSTDIQNCGTSAGILTDKEIDMNNFNFIFRDYNANATSSVGIGINSCTPAAKLDVLQTKGAIGTIGINVLNKDDSGIGIKSVVDFNSVFPACDPNKIAGWFEAATSSSVCNTKAIIIPPNGGNIGVGTLNPLFAIDVVGGVRATGGFTVSDSRYKTNVVSIRKDSSLAKIRALNGVYYDWDIVNNPAQNFETGRQIGFIAQQVSPIVPELVKIDATGYYALEYNKITALLVNAMQQLDSLVTLNKLTTDSLRQRIEQCCQKNNGGSNGGTNGNGTGGNGGTNGGGNSGGSGNGGGTNGNGSDHGITENPNQLEVELVNSSAIILNQNVPNPFAEKTLITYFIPESVNQAQILFYNDLGEILKTVDIKEKGKGQLTVYASNLSSGTYTYTLLADGNVVDTKKMVCTK